MLDSKRIGLELKLLRIKNGLTLKQASMGLNIHPNTLCRYEKNAKNISLSVFDKMLNFYNVEPNIFFEEIGAKLHARKEG